MEERRKSKIERSARKSCFVKFLRLLLKQMSLTASIFDILVSVATIVLMVVTFLPEPAFWQITCPLYYVLRTAMRAMLVGVFKARKTLHDCWLLGKVECTRHLQAASC